jgi:excisionase family DNA binding protein
MTAAPRHSIGRSARLGRRWHVQVGQMMLGCAGRTGTEKLMQTIHLNPDERQAVSRVTEAIEGLLAEGKGVTVTVAEDREYLSPQQAADRLGFSRQHLVRLINAGELPAEKLANSSYWKIPIASVVAFEERRERGRLRADEFSRGLDELGAPLG